MKDDISPRVLIYNPYVCDNDWEVASFRAEETSWALSEIGVEGTILSPRVSRARSICPGFEVHPVARDPVKRLKEIYETAITGHFNLIQERPFAGDFLSNGYGYLVSAKTGIPLMLEVHLLGSFSKLVRCLHFLPLSVWHSKLILSYLSRFKGYLSFGVPSSKVQYVPNGYSERLLQLVRGSESEIFDIHELTGTRNVIGFFGALEEHKGVNLVLAAAKRFKNNPEIAFVFAGIGRYAEEIRKLASENSSSRVFYLGLLRRRETIACIAQCKATMAMVSPWEARIGNNPVKIVESIAMGVPPLVPTDLVIPRELRPYCVTLGERNPDVLCEALQRVLAERPLSVQSEVIARYSLGRIARDILKPAYTRVIEES